MHEIVTLQLGQQSNYLATHFWNAQESYFTYAEDQESLINHDIHWRPGTGADGSETFMPRTVIYDLKGGFGSLKKVNALYTIHDDRPPQGLWGSQPVVQKQPRIEASAYQQSLDAGLEPPALTTDTVRYWSDFNRVFYHPKSVVQLNEYDLNSTLQPFEKWSTGEDLFASLDKEHDVLDRDLRPFAEEADQMQGIQIITTIDDAWGGFASRYLERMRDEYGKLTLWTWGLQDTLTGVPLDKRLLRLSNKAQTLAEAYKQSSLLVPVSMPDRRLPPNIVLDPSSRWHTSAVLATAIETATLPSRLKAHESGDSLGTIAGLLNIMGKQSIANLQLSIRGSEEDGGVKADPGRDGVRGEEGPERVQLDLDFAPPDEFALVRGRRLSGLKKARLFSQVLTDRGHDYDPSLAGSAALDELISRRHAQQPLSRRYHSCLGSPQPDSFPAIYVDKTSSPLKGPVRVWTALSTDSSVADRLKVLRNTVVRSIGIVDRETLSNDLAEMADEYHDGWSSGSDTGDDE